MEIIHVTHGFYAFAWVTNKIKQAFRFLNYKREANINCSKLEIVLTVYNPFNWQVVV